MMVRNPAGQLVRRVSYAMVSRKQEFLVKQLPGGSHKRKEMDTKVDAPLMTLSTCSYETADARFVVQGQLIELGE